MAEENIIEPVAPELIERELTPERFLRKTNKGGNEIYVVDAASAPATMREIGRLREIAFRVGGGGTGKACDIDRFDLMDPPCRQLIVWDPENRLILGGYRILLGRDMLLVDGQPRIAMAHLFDFSPEFVRDYLPASVELGRSFVRLEFQSTRAGSNAIYTLDNLWDGLGALTVVHPDIKYLIGKMTMYPSYDIECRNMLLYFLNKHFPDPDNLIRPIHPLMPSFDEEAMKRLFVGETFKDDYKVLNKSVRDRGVNIPPLVNAYMGLSPTMRVFGTAINDEFGNVEETGIFLAVAEIFEEKKQRHIGSYHPE